MEVLVGEPHIVRQFGLHAEYQNAKRSIKQLQKAMNDLAQQVYRRLMAGAMTSSHGLLSIISCSSACCISHNMIESAGECMS